jgi:hypothetical protein
MHPISIDRFAKMTVKDNPDENLADLKLRLEEAVERKKAGARCWQCGQPIWAIGSAIVGHNGCFTCITGEADHSDDYEIDEVCLL